MENRLFSLRRHAGQTACRMHIMVFSKGKHGLSLANEEWASGNFGGQYTVEQIECQVKAAEEGVLPLPEEAVARIKKIWNA